MSSIQLRTDSILQAPLHIYQKDFVFIVNGERFQTNKFIADLLSTKISKIHQLDPTISEYSINTSNKGNFQDILNLLNFKQEDISERDIPFLSEVIDNLCIEKININISTEEIRIENVIDHLSIHEKSPIFYSKQLFLEINFLSEHFYEIQENQEESFLSLNKSTIEKVINNEKLSLKSEDQLLEIINKLYQKNHDFIEFYEFVYFKNVSTEKMKEFVDIIEFECLTRNCWLSLSKRLINEKEDERDNLNRYKENIEKKQNEIKEINSELKGIFNYFKTQSNIKDEINVTSSSYKHGDAEKLLDIESKENYYCTKDEPNSWICFEFKKHKIIPSSYAIKSTSHSSNQYQLKSWIVEGSNDGSKWEEIDRQTNCSYLNGEYVIHTFSINAQKENSFKLIRIRQTDKNWGSNNHLNINSVELYGKII